MSTDKITKAVLENANWVRLTEVIPGYYQVTYAVCKCGWNLFTVPLIAYREPPANPMVRCNNIGVCYNIYKFSDLTIGQQK